MNFRILATEHAVCTHMLQKILKKKKTKPKNKPRTEILPSPGNENKFLPSLDESY